MTPPLEGRAFVERPRIAAAAASALAPSPADRRGRRRDDPRADPSDLTSRRDRVWPTARAHGGRADRDKLTATKLRDR